MSVLVTDLIEQAVDVYLLKLIELQLLAHLRLHHFRKSGRWRQWWVSLDESRSGSLGQGLHLNQLWQCARRAGHSLDLIILKFTNCRYDSDEVRWILPLLINANIEVLETWRNVCGSWKLLDLNRRSRLGHLEPNRSSGQRLQRPYNDLARLLYRLDGYGLPNYLSLYNSLIFVSLIAVAGVCLLTLIF